MKQLILIIVSLTLFSIAFSSGYKDLRFYDYDYSDRSAEKAYADKTVEEDSYADERPMYELKDAPKLFVKFIKDFNKQYKNQADYSKHYRNFEANLKDIIRLNKENKDSVADINMFADLDEKEMEAFIG